MEVITKGNPHHASVKDQNPNTDEFMVRMSTCVAASWIPAVMRYHQDVPEMLGLIPPIVDGFFKNFLAVFNEQNAAKVVHACTYAIGMAFQCCPKICIQNSKLGDVLNALASIGHRHLHQDDENSWDGAHCNSVGTLLKVFLSSEESIPQEVKLSALESVIRSLPVDGDDIESRHIYKALFTLIASKNPAITEKDYPELTKAFKYAVEEGSIESPTWMSLLAEWCSSVAQVSVELPSS